MVDADDSGALKEGLVVWKGPLPFDVAREPARFASFVAEHGATTVVVDSLKDIALDLSKDEPGARVNMAVQEALAEGVEILILHHQRKRSSDGSKPNTLDDVYGSRWLTAGAGSVLMLWGEAGDLAIEMRHLKQPQARVGPLNLMHDHDAGVTTVFESFDPLDFIRKSGAGVTVRDIAVAMTESRNPSRNEIEKARRKLDALARNGLVHCREGIKGGSDGGQPARYFAVSTIAQAS